MHRCRHSLDGLESTQAESIQDWVHVVLYAAAILPHWWLCVRAVWRNCDTILICEKPWRLFCSVSAAEWPCEPSGQILLLPAASHQVCSQSTTTSAAIQLVHSFVVSRVDYCNSILSGARDVLTDRIQSVLNAAARLIYERRRFDHVTDILRDRLHWLRVPQRIAFKSALIAYKAQHGLMSPYIARSCVLLSSLGSRYALRSATRNLMSIPRTKTKFGEHSFTVAGPSIWNALLDSVKTADSIETFKSKLKTFLFPLSFDI